MADIIQTRRDTAANWTSVDPILASGEMGYETDTGKVKYGDGSTVWSGLSYFAGAVQTEFETDDFRLLDSTDVTKELEFRLNGLTTATLRSITMPDADVDLAEIATNAAAITGKQATLVSATNIKTVNGYTLLGSGDLSTTPAATTGTGTVLSLANVVGSFYNMSSASAATTFTTSGTTAGAFAVTLINTATEPTVTGGTKISGSTWVTGTNMHLWVQYFGVTVQYWFAAL
jgi:hypothetical protein